MKHVLDAFRSLLTSDDREIKVTEFSNMWKSCSPELQQTLVENAKAMGFGA